MIIGLVQPVIGSVGGNDKVLQAVLKLLHNHEIIIYTQSKPSGDWPSNITWVARLPIHLPLMGIYKKFLMPKYDFSKCHIVISLTGLNVKTNKPLIIYDQNNLAHEFTNEVPLKYIKGFWKLYYLPYRFLNRNLKLNQKAIYVCNSLYSASQLKPLLEKEPTIIYPPVDLDEFHIEEKKKQVCVVGRISPEKNLEQTISILNETNVPCIIFGNVTATNRTYYHKLKSMAKDNVKFRINQNRSALVSLMSESKIIFTSSKETFGISTVEGIASGCIPIVPDNSAHQEVVPIHSLRYSSKSDALDMINLTMKLKGNAITSRLQDHIKQYSFDNFNDALLKVINITTNHN